jgi:hypothetical protein
MTRGSTYISVNYARTLTTTFKLSANRPDSLADRMIVGYPSFHCHGVNRQLLLEDSMVYAELTSNPSSRQERGVCQLLGFTVSLDARAAAASMVCYCSRDVQVVSTTYFHCRRSGITCRTIILFVLKIVRRMYVKVTESFSVCVDESFSLSVVLNFLASYLDGTDIILKVSTQNSLLLK